MQFATMTAGLALLITTTLSVAVSASSGVLPYPLVMPLHTGTWNGHDFAINGTSKDVIAQLEAMYGPNTNPAPAPEALAPRETSNKNGLICIPVPGQPWGKANYDDANGAIADCASAPGTWSIWQRVCALVGYHGDGCVVLCNDHDFPISPTPSYIASYAQDLVNQCTSKYRIWYSGGQEFDSDSYNVILASCQTVNANE